MRGSGELSKADMSIIESSHRATVAENKKRHSQKKVQIKFTFNDYDMSDPESVVGNEE